ncbi:glutamate 5-kinase [Bartonella sp. AR 15-3]|nr:glutamate 5-kinase [Bartonella sp. AR 15-3]
MAIDQGAIKALEAGKSLFSTRVVAVEGMFDREDTIAIIDESGIEIARGLINYGADEAKIIISYKNEEIEYILGNEVCFVVMHCNDIVLGCL